MFRAQQCSKHVEAYNKSYYKTRICALSSLITNIPSGFQAYIFLYMAQLILSASRLFTIKIDCDWASTDSYIQGPFILVQNKSHNESLFYCNISKLSDRVSNYQQFHWISL